MSIPFVATPSWEREPRRAVESGASSDRVARAHTGDATAAPVGPIGGADPFDRSQSASTAAPARSPSALAETGTEADADLAVHQAGPASLVLKNAMK